MIEKYDYDWPEAEDDNLDELLKKAYERNKNKTVEELDDEWDEFVKNLKLETIQKSTQRNLSAFFVPRKEILMNKYKKLIELIEDNGLEIQSKECYDSRSAWTGKNLWIVDKKKQNKIFDLSGNGYCFHDDKVDEAVEEVEKYLSLKNMDTFDAFKEWVDKNAKPRK